MMHLTSKSFTDGERMPGRLAFAVPDETNHARLSDNENPHLAISDVPEGTRSLAVVCHDPDVPSKPDDVNQEGKTVPESLPRVDFYHWVLVDLPPDRTEIAEGEFSEGVTARGKPGPSVETNLRQGLNDYTKWFSGDADMEGQYFGYDGPCPPWNDERLHHYHFTVYALDLAKAPVEGVFDGPAFLASVEGHVLAKAEVVGTYSLANR